MNPLWWGVLAGGLAGWIIQSRRRPGHVVMAPKYPRKLTKKNRLNLPGQERTI